MELKYGVFFFIMIIFVLFLLIVYIEVIIVIVFNFVLKFKVVVFDMIFGGRWDVLERFWRIFFKFVLLVLVFFILNKLVVVDNFLIFVEMIFSLFVVVKEFVFVKLICWLVVELFVVMIIELFNLVFIFGNVVFIVKLVLEIVVRLKGKLFFFIDFGLGVFLFFDGICLIGVFIVFFGILLGNWKFLMIYLLFCFCLRVIFKFGVFVVLGFFLGCFVVVVVREFVVVVVIFVVLKENVGDIEENVNVLKVGEGVFRLKFVNDGEVFRNIGVLGLDGVLIVVLNRVVLEGSDRFVNLVDGCFLLIGRSSFLFVLIGSFFSLMFCVFLMMYCIVVGIERYL